MAHALPAPRPLRFALDGHTILLELPREDGLDLLEWRVRVREADTLRQIASQIVDALGDAPPTRLVHFG